MFRPRKHRMLRSQWGWAGLGHLARGACEELVTATRDDATRKRRPQMLGTADKNPRVRWGCWKIECLAGWWWLEHEFYVSIYWEWNNHPNWLIFFRVGEKPPTNLESTDFTNHLITVLALFFPVQIMKTTPPPIRRSHACKFVEGNTRTPKPNGEIVDEEWVHHIVDPCWETANLVKLTAFLDTCSKFHEDMAQSQHPFVLNQTNIGHCMFEHTVMIAAF